MGMRVNTIVECSDCRNVMAVEIRNTDEDKGVVTIRVPSFDTFTVLRVVVLVNTLRQAFRIRAETTE